MRRTLGLVLALCVLAAGAPAATGSGGPSTTQVAVGEGSVWATAGAGTVRIAPRGDPRVVAEGDAESLFADGSVVAGGSAWTLGGGSLTRIDLATGRIIGTPIRVGDPPAALVAGGDRVYVIDQYGGGRISQISTTTGRSAGRGFLPGRRLWTGRVAGGSLWVAQHGFQTPRERREGGYSGAGRILRLDRATGTVAASVEVGHVPIDTAAAWGSLWVIDDSDRTLRRIDLATSRVTATIPLPRGARAVTAAAGRLWVALPDGVVRIDPGRGRIVGRTQIPGGVIDLETGLGSVWAGSACGGRVLRLAPGTGRIIDRIAVPTARPSQCPGD
jgi:DNA-binding beta-propeller fold protein YncE